MCNYSNILVECVIINNNINNIRAKMDSKEKKNKKEKNDEEVWKKEAKKEIGFPLD